MAGPPGSSIHADSKEGDDTDSAADDKWMRRFTECTLKLNELKRTQRASSVVELGMSNRILVTFVFVLMDIVLCTICIPRNFILKVLWMAVWFSMTYLSFNNDPKSPLFIVLLVNAAMPFLKGHSAK